MNIVLPDENKLFGKLKIEVGKKNFLIYNTFINFDNDL
jgi:hypothetical protein